MNTLARSLPAHGRLAALVATFCLVNGCATFHPATERGAVETALHDVCGASRSPSDSSCVVRNVTRIANGYRVVVDRRPPAGNDRVAVVVRPAGLLGGASVEVTPLDTAATPR